MRSREIPSVIIIQNLAQIKTLQYDEKQKENGEPVYIDSLSYEEFKLLGQADMERRFVELDEQEQKERYNEEQARELDVPYALYQRAAK